MKSLLTFLLSLLALTGLRAANPSFTDLVQTNILWVAKNGNDSTAKPGNPALKYASISNAIQAAVSPAVVKVAAGTYAGSLLLKDGVDIECSGLVTVTQSANIGVMFDNSQDVTCRISGPLYMYHTGTGGSADGFKMGGFTEVWMDGVSIETVGSGGIGLRVEFGSMHFKNGQVHSGGRAISFQGTGNNDFSGLAVSTNDYAAIIGNAGSNYVTGSFYAGGNSAIHCPSSSGYVLLDRVYAFTSDGDFGWALENSGGRVEARHSTLVSQKRHAIAKYGGSVMVLDDCQLLAGTNSSTLYSIDNDGQSNHGEIQIRSTCWGNLPPNPAMNITHGQVIVTNAGVYKAAQVFKSVHDKTNIVANTNGVTWFPEGAASYSTLTTNAVGGTGYTNNQTINQTVFLNGTGVAVTMKNRSGTTIVPATTFTGTMTVVLQPGWAVTAASGLTGTAVPF